MLEKNKEYIVDIIDNGFQGEGIAKIDGITVFVEGAIKGEKAKVKILKTMSDFCYAKIVEIIDKSNYRKEPDCYSYKRCGGCDLRHVNYEETLKIKNQIVKNCLQKALKKEIEIQNTVGMKNPIYYRNKLVYPIGLNADDKPIMGVYASRTHEITSVKECMIQDKLLQKIANDIFEFIELNNVKPYNENTLKGTIRHIVIRNGKKTNEIMIILVVNDTEYLDLTKRSKFISYITEKYPQIKTIIKNINGEKTNVILGPKNEIIYGNGYIYDILGEYKFKISPNSFYQINPVQTELLYNKAVQFVKGKNYKTAIDLYCGIGTIGIFVAQYFGKIYGVECVEEAVEDAQENAKLNNVENIEFMCGTVETEDIHDYIKEIKPNVVFIDPPRKGLDTCTIDVLLEAKPEMIIYISCNPATLARDLVKLEEKYNIKEVIPFDMFPWTKHIECISLLQLKEIL
jgi:23S rRNA (uracil1939-C5)-methyltransferase